jgi:hypothetical protein
MPQLVHELPGKPLRDADYQKLESSWITPELADQALLRRVTSGDGAQIIGRKGSGDYEGVVFPYIWPGEDHAHAYRLRRDRPPVEYDAAGKPKEREKYLSAPGQGNRLYIVPGTNPDWLQDVQIPFAFTEGEKKTIALHRLALHAIDPETGKPPFLRSAFRACGAGAAL